MSAEKAAAVILEGLKAKKREVLVAEGLELAAAQMRNQDPEQLFARLALEGARLAALREKQGSGFSLEPATINASA